METSIEGMITKIKQRLINEKLLFSQILEIFPDQDYRDFLIAWGKLMDEKILNRTDEEGYYFIKHNS